VGGDGVGVRGFAFFAGLDTEKEGVSKLGNMVNAPLVGAFTSGAKRRVSEVPNREIENQDRDDEGGVGVDEIGEREGERV